MTIGLVMVFAYTIFIKKDNTNDSALVSTTNQNTNTTQNTTQPTAGQQTQLAQDFLTLLLSVKSITLNDSIFADTAFKSLRDSSILLIPDGNEGRPNPFAPIGSDVALPTVPSANSLQGNVNSSVNTTVPSSNTSVNNTSTNTDAAFDAIDLNFDNADLDLGLDSSSADSIAN